MLLLLFMTITSLHQILPPVPRPPPPFGVLLPTTLHTSCRAPCVIAIPVTTAVSTRKIDCPNNAGWNPAFFNTIASKSVQPRSGPIAMIADIIFFTTTIPPDGTIGGGAEYDEYIDDDDETAAAADDGDGASGG